MALGKNSPHAAAGTGSIMGYIDIVIILDVNGLYIERETDCSNINVLLFIFNLDLPIMLLR